MANGQWHVLHYKLSSTYRLESAIGNRQSHTFDVVNLYSNYLLSPGFGIILWLISDLNHRIFDIPEPPFVVGNTIVDGKLNRIWTFYTASYES